MNYAVNRNSSYKGQSLDVLESLKRLFYFGTFFKKTTSNTQKTLADKICEPAKIQEMRRIYTSPEEPLEEKTIDRFLHFYFCLPQNIIPMPHTG